MEFHIIFDLEEFDLIYVNKDLLDIDEYISINLRLENEIFNNVLIHKDERELLYNHEYMMLRTQQYGVVKVLNESKEVTFNVN